MPWFVFKGSDGHIYGGDMLYKLARFDMVYNELNPSFLSVKSFPNKGGKILVFASGLIRSSQFFLSDPDLFKEEVTITKAYLEKVFVKNFINASTENNLTTSDNHPELSLVICQNGRIFRIESHNGYVIEGDSFCSLERHYGYLFPILELDKGHRDEKTAEKYVDVLHNYKECELPAVMVSDKDEEFHLYYGKENK